MATRENDTESCTSSSVGLELIALGRGNTPHEQCWTHVEEFDMGLRQQLEVDPFENWKYDVQSQIANIATKIERTFEDYPDLRPSKEIPISSSAITQRIMARGTEEQPRNITYKTPAPDYQPVTQLAYRKKVLDR